MNKFDRTYKLTVQTKPAITAQTLPGNVDATGSPRPDVATSSAPQQLVIQPPFTIQFNINRSMMASYNTMTIQIYNLNEAHRNAIFADRFYPYQVVDNKYTYRQIVFEAGYKSLGALATVFVGSIMCAYSYRQGSDIITVIEARDFGYDVVTTQTSTTLEAGTSKKDALTQMANSFPNITQGVIGDIQGDFQRPVVLDGNTFVLMKKYAQIPDAYVYVDLKKINILQPNEAIKGEVINLTAADGLLNSPQRGDASMIVQSLFEPRPIMGQLINVKGSFFTQYNGTYKVCGVNHQGIISEAVSGQCVSTFNLLLNNQLFGKTTILTP